MSIFLDLALRSSIVLALGLGARQLLRHRSAALRHRVVAASLFASASVLPLYIRSPGMERTASRSASAATTVSVDEPYGCRGLTSDTGRPYRPVEAFGRWQPSGPSALWAGAGNAHRWNRAPLAQVGAHAAGNSGKVHWSDLTARIAGTVGLHRPVTLLQTHRTGPAGDVGTLPVARSCCPCMRGAGIAIECVRGALPRARAHCACRLDRPDGRRNPTHRVLVQPAGLAGIRPSAVRQRTGVRRRGASRRRAGRRLRGPSTGTRKDLPPTSPHVGIRDAHGAAVHARKENRRHVEA